MFNRKEERGFWRPLVGIAVAYAIAAQSLFIVLGGFGLIAPADRSVPGFTLCHHDDSDAPAAPAGAPDQPPCNHCIFCFAGSQHVVLASPPPLLRDLVAEVVEVRPPAASHIVILRSAYTIAIPRGPPLAA
jgi:hypothetical protein